MTKTVPVIGVEAEELPWVRMLIFLLRHADPGVPELTRQALHYLTDAAVNVSLPSAKPHDYGA